MSQEASKEIPVGIVVLLEVLLEELSGWLMLRLRTQGGKVTSGISHHNPAAGWKELLLIS